MNTWYTQLNQPPLTPPNWIFGPVWTILYLMIASAIIIYVRATRSAPPYLVYSLIGFHLVTNIIWTLIFFRLQSPGWALVDILLLDLSLLALILFFWQTSRLSSILLWPYFVWVLFATYLNAAFYYLNNS